MHDEQSIIVHAPLDVVWRTLTEINEWPTWQSAVSRASLQDPLAVQASFAWTARGMKIKSRIIEISEPTALRWTGHTLGIRADHAWSLEATEDETRVTTSESLEGWLISIMKFLNKDFLANSLRQSLSDLKEESERRRAV